MGNAKCKNKKLVRKLITHCPLNLCTEQKKNIMQNTFVKADFKVDAFKANRIIFDDSDLVSIEIKCKLNEKWIKTNLLFTFRKFNDLLRFSGSIGEKMQLLVSDKLLFTKEKPYVIDVENDSYVFSNCSLEVSYVIEEDLSCFSVEEVIPIPYLQQIKSLRKNIADFADVHLHNQTSLNSAIAEMASMYRYYKGLTELNLSEEAAREKAGLLNEHLFKLAFHASCQK